MSYLVFCIFELRTPRREDYLYAYADLAKLGMKRVIKADDGRSISIPANAVLGMFDGKSANAVRSSVVKSVQDLFKSRDYTGDFFVVVSADWACGGGSN
jgi:hypothetical protein